MATIYVEDKKRNQQWLFTPRSNNSGLQLDIEVKRHGYYDGEPIWRHDHFKTYHYPGMTESLFRSLMDRVSFSGHFRPPGEFLYEFSHPNRCQRCALRYRLEPSRSTNTSGYEHYCDYCRADLNSDRSQNKSHDNNNYARQAKNVSSGHDRDEIEYIEYNGNDDEGSDSDTVRHNDDDNDEDEYCVEGDDDHHNAFSRHNQPRYY